MHCENLKLLILHSSTIYPVKSWRLTWQWDIVVDLVTGIRAGISEVRISTGARNLFLLQDLQIGFGTHLASCSISLGEK